MGKPLIFTALFFRPMSMTPKPGWLERHLAAFVSLFRVQPGQIAALFKRSPRPARMTKIILWVVGALLTPITLAGALIGFGKAYLRFDFPLHKEPGLHPLTPIGRVAMIIWAVLIWAILLAVLWAIYMVISLLVPAKWLMGGAVFYYLLINAAFALVVFIFFRQWQVHISRLLQEKRKFGSARFAEPGELQEFISPDGLYIGDIYSFNAKGHLFSCAGTRSGKFTDIIAPNLLGLRSYKGSWVIIDPKGEICAVTSRYQREIGKKVVVLNPWDLLSGMVPESQPYNPLDILGDGNNPHLVDDIQVIAEMIVPEQPNQNENFFTDNARALIAGLLLQLATTVDKKHRTLKTLWEWVRLPKDEFLKLMEDMHVNDHPLFGPVVVQAAFEIEKLMQAGDRTFGSILATALQCTDFIKSPSLQQAMNTGFDPYELADGNTVVYVIIPADKLKSHSRWLRLVVTTTMRSVVRKPGKRVTFLLDEFASLGYLPEISEIALSTYAGFNITVWPIFQSLIQLKNLYGDGWENFIGNSAVRHFFGVNDNFTAEYISDAIGETTNVIYKKSALGLTTQHQDMNARRLVTPDEIRRGSGAGIFAFFASHPVTYFSKRPYFRMPELINNDKPVYEENPYYK